MRALLVLFTALALLSACGGGRPSVGSNSARESPTTPAPIRTLAPIPPGWEDAFSSPNRDRYAICVEAVGVPEGTQALALTAIRGALKEVAEHPIWYRTPFGLPPPNEMIVDEGCPTGPRIYKGAHERINMSYPRSAHVAEGSYYSEFIYIIPAEDIDWIDGHRLVTTKWFTDNAESICEFDSCHTVTEEAYLSPESLGDRPLLVDRVRAILGLEDCSNIVTDPNFDSSCS